MHGNFRKPLKSKGLHPSHNGWHDCSPPKGNEKKKREGLQKPDDSQQKAYVLKSIQNYVRKQVPIAARKRTLSQLSFPLTHDNHHELAALNPYAGSRFAEYVHHALERTPTSVEARAVTLISDTLNADINGAWPSIEEAREFVATWLHGLAYLMLIQVGFRRISDIEVDRNGYRRHIYRKLVCFHAHGIVWAEGRLIERRLNGIPPSLGAPGLKQKPMPTPLGWLRYSAADPRLIETARRRSFARGYERGAAKISLKLQAQLVHHFDGVTVPDMCVVAGFGERVLKRALKRAAANGYSGCFSSV